MQSPAYRRLKEKALRTAERLGLPSFYRENLKELDRSSLSCSESEMLHRCRSYLAESRLHPAHGIAHCEKVALEAGAVLQIEGSRSGYSVSDLETLMLCAQIAGLLHDIRRIEHNHTISGSIEARRILGSFDLDDSHKNYIAAAIRNHEAFKEVLCSEDESAKLISDSLYDADKFRWGPDNFTVTLWLIMESEGMSAEILFTSFREKMEGIRRIKDTFRTETGKKYGPEFIDFGIEIGNEIYSELEYIIGN